ncbi:hypothetical protein [Rhodopseudomonas palustris]|uniref:Uncharacterized protein n=1 Tax=Rhodopseudomonas palustris (strain ATCC BAA-98 / CGA009) TaxID=258594 RepID=A0AAF0BPQ4_RHOPA|nr:hypothetical protein [Rhodopseudomonas palustris]OPF92702.1 hypothetical protein B1S06_16240 [Rhodopseudomonas palustris]QQM05434.1 hypothetical protein I8G32_04003 [Rhodopseudomonas palustris]WAB76775.1 hypothetical protein OR798_20100 [Rhodopseudomonas palustris]WCL94060.1 hypothetical protein TX73_020095 [Rhodopseudomonas palustris CGA009]WND50687.1 hypothetical protein L1A21_20020 [Rhodopseudomonas palustris]
MNIERQEIRRREQIVSKEYGGILPHCEAFYIHSIHYSASRAQRAFGRLSEELLQGLSATFITASIHEALSHSAALSRYFWPSRNKGVAEARSFKLRRAFSLDDGSPLRNRKLRDALDHFDERLDEYLLTYDTGYFFPTPMIDNHELASDPSARIFKLVDPHAKRFVVLGEQFSFEHLAEETARISALAQLMGNTGRLLSTPSPRALDRPED